MPFFDWWWPPMMWFPLFPLIFIAICLMIFVFVMVPMMRRHGPWRDSPGYSEKTALDILNERFARGEIDKTEYEEKRRVIAGPA